MALREFPRRRQRKFNFFTFSVFKVEYRKVYSFIDSLGIRLSGEPTEILGHLSLITNPQCRSVQVGLAIRSIS